MIENFDKCDGCQGKNVLVCQICNLTVRGLAFQCLSCGHGGHRDHIKDYMKNQIEAKKKHASLTN
jgi:hypothetical protein